jgi:hypothetical protein
MMSTLQKIHSLRSNLPDSMLHKLLRTCVRGNLQTSTTMLAACPKYLNDFGLWTPSCIAMHSLWATKPKGETYSFKHFSPFIKAIGIPSLRSSGVKFISFGMRYMPEEQALQINGGYLFCSHSPKYFKKKRR